MTKPRLLYAEDDLNLAFVTKDGLEGAGFDVTHCADATGAWQTFSQSGEPFRLCLLDVRLPPTDGFTLAGQIRQADAHVPLLFLSALGDKDHRLRGLRLGADDYLTKPFSMEELVLKIEVFLRRTTLPGASSTVDNVAPGAPSLGESSLGQFQFDYANLTLRSTTGPRSAERGPAGLQVLTQREADVLAYLLARRGQLVRRDELLRALWGDNDYFMGRSLDVFITRLRKRLRPDPSVRIENLHGVGFRLSA